MAPAIVPGSATSFALTDERYAFAGHEVCKTSPMVNGLSGIPAGSGDFHPNTSGYAKEATDIAANPLGTWPHYTTLRDRLPGTPDKATAISMYNLLTRGAYGAATQYDRRYFQLGSAEWLSWPSYANCKTGQLVLLRDNETPPYSFPLAAGTCGNGTYGALPRPTTWHTPYDDPSVLVTTSNPTTSPLYPTADHIVPLADAWNNGADAWAGGLAVEFANDWYGIELVTASAQTNNCTYAYPNGKCDQSIEEWQPPNGAYVCAYAELWVAIKYQWNLRIDNTRVYHNAGRPGDGYTEASYLSAILNNPNGTVPNGCM